LNVLESTISQKYNSDLNVLESTISQKYNSDLNVLESSSSQKYNSDLNILEPTTSENYNSGLNLIESTISQKYNSELNIIESTTSQNHNSDLNILESTSSLKYNSELNIIESTNSEKYNSGLNVIETTNSQNHNSELNIRETTTSHNHNSELNIREPISSENNNSELNIKEPSTFKIEIKTSKLDTKEPNTSKIIPTESYTSKLYTIETKTESTTSELEKTKLITSQIVNTTINTQIDKKEATNIPSSIVEKTEHSSIIDDKKSTIISSINENSEHFSETEKEITYHINENNTLTPYNIYSTSLTYNENTSIPIKETTKNIITTSTNDNKEPTTTINELTNKIETTIYDNKKYSTLISTTAINKSINETIKTSIPTTINQEPQVAIPNSTIITTKENIIQTTEGINHSIVYPLVVIGYSHFVKLLTKITFNIYFTCLSGPFYSKRLRFPVEMTSNRILRTLETYEAICEANEEEAKEKISYSCEIEAQIENITNIQIINEFIFSSINANISFSPLAENYKDKIQEIENVFDNLINSTIYILDHSKIGQYKYQYFNISGVINEQKSKFQKIDINLMVFTNNENVTKKTQLNCTIIEIIEKNYTINCQRNADNNNYNLQNAISIYEDEILVINFDNGANSSITFENENKYNRYRFISKTRSLNAGGIVAIILVMIAVVIALFFAIIFLRKKDTNRVERSNEGESSIMKLSN